MTSLDGDGEHIRLTSYTMELSKCEQAAPLDFFTFGEMTIDLTVHQNTLSPDL